MSTAKALHRQYLTIISHWPRDPLRPHVSFRESLAHRLNAYFDSHVEADSRLPTQNSGSATAAAAAATQAGSNRQALKFDAKRVEREINVLGGLLEDRFKKRYPLGENMLRPKGNPGYYEKLMKELRAAPERSWLQRTLNSWKGYIRMS